MLTTFVTIAELKSFGDAARRLNMTLSAVSMQMKSLEADLGAALFDRGHRPPRLTAQGAALVPYARAVTTAERELLRASAPQAALAGTLHVGFVLSASVRLLPSFLKAAQRDAPNVTFEVATGLSEALEKKVADGRLDLAVLTAVQLDDEVFEYRVLRTEPLVYALPRTHEANGIDWLFAHLPFLHFAPATGIGQLISRHLDALTCERHRTIVLDGMEASMECARAGVGFTILPEPDVARYADLTIATRPVHTPSHGGNPTTETITRDIALIARRGHFSPQQWRQVTALFDHT
ncbi:MAG: LysR family transcriptional regulator [Pseudomonadota bacterium]